GRRSKIDDDEQDGRCADRNLDRREGESDTRRDWSSLSEQAGTVRQAERSRNVRGGGASNFHLERIETDWPSMRREGEPEERHGIARDDVRDLRIGHDGQGPETRAQGETPLLDILVPLDL